MDKTAFRQQHWAASIKGVGGPRWVEQYEIEYDDLDDLRNISAVELEEKHLLDIRKAVEDSVMDKYFYDNPLEIGQIVRRVNRINKAARELRDALNEKDEESSFALHSIHEDFMRSVYIESDIDDMIAYRTCLDRFKADLLTIIKTSDISHPHFDYLRPTKRGRRPQDWLYWLISNVADIYEDAGGTPSYTTNSADGVRGGSFVELCWAIQCLLPPEAQASDKKAFGERVRRVLDQRRKTAASR